MDNARLDSREFRDDVAVSVFYAAYAKVSSSRVWGFRIRRIAIFVYAFVN